MIVLRKVDRHEMARRFAVGEVHSGFFFSQDEINKQETLQLLTSGDRGLECLGIQNHRKTRGPFVDSLPGDTEWFLARLRLSEDEFVRLRTVNVDGWIKYTNGSLGLIDAAIFLQANPDVDPRVTAVVSACKQGRIELCGITLFGRTMDGPLTIVEGTARLVALYLTCVQQVLCPLCIEEIKIILGLSQANWSYS
jgi:hypothetical protein